MKELLLIIVSSALVNNVVLSQFMGLCPFLGVSKTTDTAAGMGGAVIFVITLSSFVTSVIYKLILQPLVENALYHGIKESDQDRGTIWIRAFSESEDSIILKVEDDGAGMSQERIDQLNSWLKLKERGEEVKAYGTLNVNDRIKIAYGDEYGLHYEKRTGGGTVAVVRLKRLQKEVCGKF